MLNSPKPVKEGSVGFVLFCCHLLSFHLVQSGLKSKSAALRAEGKALVIQGFNWERD